MTLSLSRACDRFLRNPRSELIAFFIFALLLSLGIGLRDPWPADEPRFALVAWQMLHSGSWLFPHRGVELYSDKPPLFMWLEAGCYWITGGWRGWFLIPSLLASLGTLALVYDLAKRQWTHRIALLAAGAVLVSFDFTFQMRAAQIDSVEVFWITLANYGLLRHFLLGPSWYWFLLGCFAAGLGVITKGVGVLALLMFAPYVFACLRDWHNVTAASARNARWWLGLLAFLFPILGWALPMLWMVHVHDSPEYTHYAHDILLGQTYSRYAHATGGQLRPWWYYLVVIALQWLPLSLALPWAFSTWANRLRRHDARILLPLAWSIMTVLFFSISPGKRNVYILPVMPMVALALAPVLPGIVRNRWFRFALWLIALALAMALLTMGVLMRGGHLQSLTARAAMTLEASPAPLVMMLIGVGAVGILIAVLARPHPTRAGWCAFVLVVWGTWGLAAYPMLNGYPSTLEMMTHVSNRVPRHDQIGLVAWKEQNLLMLHRLGRPSVNWGFLLPWHEQLQRALAWQAADPAHRWIFTLGDVLAPCVKIDRAIHVGHANHQEWYLFKRNAVAPNCAPSASEDARQVGAYDPEAED